MHFVSHAATRQYARVVRTYETKGAAYIPTDSFLGQSSLPESCPVCDHTPIAPELCKPNKALRTTLKAFLRTEEKKREKDRPAIPATSLAVVPAASTSVPTVTAPSAQSEDVASIDAHATPQNA